MKNRIESAVEMEKIPEETRKQHKGFAEWNLNVKKNDHHSIVQVLIIHCFYCKLLFSSFLSLKSVDFITSLSQILIDGRDANAIDNDGNRLPTLVYMAREKRPNWPHNFKAGAMNALVRLLTN